MLHGPSFKRTAAAGIADEGQHDLLHKGRFVLCQACSLLNMVAVLAIPNGAPNGLLLIASDSTTTQS